MNVNIYKGYNHYKITMGDKKNKLTTVAVYKSDLKELDKMMDKNELYREQIHNLIIKEKKRLRK